MSLINDALKRVSGLSKRHAADASGGPPPLPPLEPAGNGGGKGRGGIIALLLVVLAGGAWAVFHFWPAGTTEVAAAQTNSVLAAASSPVNTPDGEAAPDEASPAEPAGASAEPETDPVQAAVPAPPEDPVAASEKPVAAEPPPRPRPEFPALALHGILRSETRPAALINGQAIRLGESVAGARLVQIDSGSVTFEKEGETQVFKLRK